LAMVMVTFVLLREDKQAQKALANRQYIEHTPVYEDDQQQCSSR
ncbi:ciprofloxacin tolerance protein AciT, partial [Acinetobacter baumannii]